MRGAVLHGARDVRFEERDEPKIIEPTDAIVRLSASCVCGSDLWPYRGIQPTSEPTPMGHEDCGIVEEVGRAVTSIKRGQFVIGSFFASDRGAPPRVTVDGISTTRGEAAVSKEKPPSGEGGTMRSGDVPPVHPRTTGP